MNSRNESRPNETKKSSEPATYSTLTLGRLKGDLEKSKTYLGRLNGDLEKSQTNLRGESENINN
jgi:hypothetical protein